MDGPLKYSDTVLDHYRNPRNVGEIEELAGCDLLTISPALLAELRKNMAPLTRRLSPEIAAGSDIAKLDLDERKFRWLFNEDAMATDKLAEGIRRFDADARKLEKLIVSLAAAAVTAK